MDSNDEFNLMLMIRVAEEAGRIIMSHRENPKARKKDDRSVVTAADMAVNNYLRRAVPQYFPECSLLTEETAEDEDATLERMAKKDLIIADELDGSGDFARGEDDFCFLIAYVRNGMPIGGVVNEPLKRRIMFGVKGNGAYVVNSSGTPKELPQARHVSWEDAVVGHPKNYKGKKYEKIYEIMGIPPERLMRSGSMGTRMMQAALQETHMIIGYTRKLNEWDVCAGHAVLEAMGISVTDIRGNPLSYNKEVPKTHMGIVVAHPAIKDELFERLAKCYTQVNM